MQQLYTITSCAPEVTNCPAHSTSVSTEVIPLYTTVCPVSEASSAPAVSTYVAPTTSKPAGIITVPASGSGAPTKTTSSGSLEVTAAAGRLTNGLEMAAAAAGALAVAFL